MYIRKQTTQTNKQYVHILNQHHDKLAENEEKPMTRERKIRGKKYPGHLKSQTNKQATNLKKKKNSNREQPICLLPTHICMMSHPERPKQILLASKYFPQIKMMAPKSLSSIITKQKQKQF
eukprot:c1911_g1_i1.p1 GENE.c1911_g1_i1~~c1911_g1_i1.p1  ORF type:complete len:121 (+),score=22.74 c1911_g1_i1:395-757(+)